LIGYRHIIELAEGQYVDAIRSIEYAAMAGFFARGGSLDPELCDYFAGFQQVISYLFDPDGIFAANLERAGVRHFLAAHVSFDDGSHAAAQLARPLESLALYLENPAAEISPAASHLAAATAFLAPANRPLFAIHPGSGSKRKNWPTDRWMTLIRALLDRRLALVIVGGEADTATLDALDASFPRSLLFARDLPLPRLAAILARCSFFLGHDSGISHLAAAVGTQSLLLFGPTDPHVWAPANPHVKILTAPDGDLAALPVDAVLAQLDAFAER
jgi:heptosyltransferase-3